MKKCSLASMIFLRFLISISEVLLLAISLNNAYTWAINTCNRAHVGYSQPYRNQRTVNGVTYYDCSSFIWYALKAGGFDVNAAYQTATGSAYSGNAITTHNMAAWLTTLGFTQKNILTEKWLAGDVVLIHSTSRQHTEMVYQGTNNPGEGYTMGAHSASYTLGRQVSINTNLSYASNYQTLWRYGSGGASEDLQWIKGNKYLNQSEMQNNAQIIYNYLHDKGWSDNAIAAVLGNMQEESTINPGVWQNLTPNINMGYGLVQWTPSTKYTNWADSKGYAHDNGNAQLKWIDEEMTNSGEWLQNPNYPTYYENYADFKTDTTHTVEWLTLCFLHSFERTTSHIQNRVDNANAWYTYITGLTPQPPEPIDPDYPPSESIKSLPVWMMLKYI